MTDDQSTWMSRLIVAGAVLEEVSARVGCSVHLDVRKLLGQRTMLRGLRPQRDESAGVGSRLLPTRDGWVAMTLNRADDWELLPALFGTNDVTGWDAVHVAVSTTRAADLAERAGELGLAVGVLPDGDEPSDAQWLARRDNRHGPWVIRRGSGDRTGRAPTKVVDLSVLWAGPLCASLLQRAGAEVVTVESTSRPDGARHGDPELHAALHDGNSFVSLDFADSAGVRELHRLIDDADVVVSSARIRALEQLGLDPYVAVERRPGLTWVGISAYGLTGPWRNRIGYGDDTAVAGGLVMRDPSPAFFADAAADPITGLYAAIAAIEVSMSGGGVIDAALRDAAAHVARPPQAQVRP